MTTKAEAIKAAGEALAEGELAVFDGTVTDAARRSTGYLTGRYSLEEMEQRISAHRARARQTTAGPDCAPAARSGEKQGRRSTTVKRVSA